MSIINPPIMYVVDTGLNPDKELQINLNAISFGEGLTTAPIGCSLGVLGFTTSVAGIPTTTNWTTVNTTCKRAEALLSNLGNTNDLVVGDTVILKSIPVGVSSRELNISAADDAVVGEHFGIDWTGAGQPFVMNTLDATALQIRDTTLALYDSTGTPNTTNLTADSVTIVGGLTRTWTDILNSTGSTNSLDQVLANGNTATGTYANINLVDTDVGNIANPILNLQNSNATGSVAMECYKNKPTAAVNGDVLFTQSVFGKDSTNLKQEYTRINHSVRDNTAFGEDGSIEFGCFVNGAVNTFIQINGNENEVNILRTLDMTGNNIRTSTGDLSILTTTSSGNGNMTISTNGSNAVGDITISAKNNMVLSCGTAPDTIDLQGGVKMTNGRQIVLTNASNSDTGYVNSQAISITDGIETGTLQKGIIQTITSTTSNTMTPTNLTINDSSASPTIEQVVITPVSIQFTSSGTASDSMSIYNDSADGGEIEWFNVSGTNGLAITSSHSLTLKATASTYPIQLDSDVINLQNTNTTTSTANHNADIKTTSNGLESTTFLKLQLNGADIWLPYFTSDPSL
jgi:hypothetical protein